MASARREADGFYARLLAGQMVGGGVPIETPHGWLLYYHGYDQEHNYRLSVCLLDLDEPQRVIARPAEFILEPVETWELKGDVPRVVFSGANPVVDSIVHVYYGGADRVIALATCDLAETLDWVLRNVNGSTGFPVLPSFL